MGLAVRARTYTAALARTCPAALVVVALARKRLASTVRRARSPAAYTVRRTAHIAAPAQAVVAAAQSVVAQSRSPRSAPYSHIYCCASSPHCAGSTPIRGIRIWAPNAISPRRIRRIHWPQHAAAHATVPSRWATACQTASQFACVQAVLRASTCAAAIPRLAVAYCIASAVEAVH